MIRCLAVDDEAYAAEIIANYIKKTPFLTLVATVTSALEALQLIQEKKVDLVFLDIQMPELTGIQFLKICNNECKVILTTAYSEYAVEGFDLDVVDYLLKPVPYERFYKAALKAQQQLEKENSPLDFIFVKGETKNKFIKIDYNDILYIEGLKNYVSIYTTSQRIVTYQTLRELEDILPYPPFYRVHRSYIVSTSQITVIDGNQITIATQAIPIGETYKEGFFKLIRERF
jgi:two-component system response regulator LytT